MKSEEGKMWWTTKCIALLHRPSYCMIYQTNKQTNKQPFNLCTVHYISIFRQTLQLVSNRSLTHYFFSLLPSYLLLYLLFTQISLLLFTWVKSLLFSKTHTHSVIKIENVSSNIRLVLDFLSFFFWVIVLELFIFLWVCVLNYYNNDQILFH